jgi:hypothetical protein
MVLDIASDEQMQSCGLLAALSWQCLSSFFWTKNYSFHTSSSLKAACKKVEKNHLENKFSKRPPWLASIRRGRLSTFAAAREILLWSRFVLFRAFFQAI